MNDSNARFNEIDAAVEDSGHSFNPQTERFEAIIGSDADNNLDHDWQSFASTLPDVTEEELRNYISWKMELTDHSRYQKLADELTEE